MLFPTVTSFLASFLAVFIHDRPHTTPSFGAQQHQQQQPAPLHFELRHLHAVSPDARVLFHDVRKADVDALAATTAEPASYALRPRPVRAHRPRSLDALQRARVRSMRFMENEALEWEPIEVEGPDVESRETLLLLAKMTNNAYLEPGEAGWYELGDRWNVVSALRCCTLSGPRIWGYCGEMWVAGG